MKAAREFGGTGGQRPKDPVGADRHSKFLRLRVFCVLPFKTGTSRKYFHRAEREPSYLTENFKGTERQNKTAAWWNSRFLLSYLLFFSEDKHK